MVSNNFIKVFGKSIFRLLGKYERYTFKILRNKAKNIMHKRSDHKFLFILSPPYCGSTLLNQIISTSYSVSVNNHIGTREGQSLPTIKDKMLKGDRRRWDSNIDFDWITIKNEWMKYWDLTAPILLDKSPPNIIRAVSISKVFTPSYFIIFFRDPYAHCESLIRRNNSENKDAAKFALKCLKFQKDNIEQLDNSFSLSYEFLTSKTEEAKKLLTEFLPELNDINTDKKFLAHNYLAKKMNVTNLNGKKIQKLTNIQLDEINDVFEQEISVLEFFGYKLLKKNKDK